MIKGLATRAIIRGNRSKIVTAGFGINSQARYYSEELSMAKFHQLSDEALEHLLDEYESLTEDIPEIDVELAVCINYDCLKQFYR
jgi:hypothetical protein